MKILLLDVDSTIPNLALMKISAYHKEENDEVYLENFYMNPSKVYISCIFAKNRPKAMGMAKFWESFGVPVEIGGYGIDDRKLPDEIEHIMPDYKLYNCDYSMGFTTRGCIRRCPFCIVPQVEGPFREHAPIKEFLHPKHRKLILLDNNFLASTLWEEKLLLIMQKRLLVNFNQGLDLRLIDQEKARWLKRIHAYTHTFQTPMYHFAWDLMQDEDKVIHGLETLLQVGIRPKEITVYLLVGYNTTFQEDLYRFETLRKLKVTPYVMLWNDRKDDKELLHFERWVNRHLYKKVPFEKYDPSIKEPRT